MNYEGLLFEAEQENLLVKEKHLLAYDGRIRGNRIAIRTDIPIIDKACVLAEELGHYYTTAGDILHQDSVMDEKQERRARVWAYNKMVGIHGLIRCYKARCSNRFEMAEYLGVTEQFLEDAIEYYHSRYGYSFKTDNYLIYFEPTLFVIEEI